MPSSSPVALILGAGANVGQHVGRAFLAKGYRIALASRSLKEEDSTASQVHIRADFTDPSSVAEIFAKVKKQLEAPSVVVYNGSASHLSESKGMLTDLGWIAAAATPQDKKNPLGLPLEGFTRDFAVNTTSAFVAAQQAVLAFEQLPESASRTFIFTGNCTNVAPIVALMGSGAGKSATAHIIQCAAEAYKDKGYKFYYADERKADGSPVYSAVDGPAHAEFYTELAEGTSQGPWQQTFVKGAGYKKF